MFFTLLAIFLHIGLVVTESLQGGQNVDCHPSLNETYNATAESRVVEDRLPNEFQEDEHYKGMIYMGKLDQQGRRLGNDVDNGLHYVFGTSFSRKTSSHQQDSHVHHFGPDVFHDVADRAHGKVSWHNHFHNGPISRSGPKPFGHVDTHPLDGGVIPPKYITVEPFFLDETLVTNHDFRTFVGATYYKTEAEQYGWSFVLISFLPKLKKWDDEMTMDSEAPHWIAVDGAYWREPEGPGSSYKFRENHPVVHVSHKDAAEYCKWIGKRLPGEREWEAATRYGYYNQEDRTLYSWGNEPTWDKAKQFANLWGNDTFPWKNDAKDGWRGTSPIRHYPPNAAGFYDMTGNVWEWMRGGKHKQRIVRGGSYVDSLDGSFNHAATLGARATIHGTTTTGNVGFRCARSPMSHMELVMHENDNDRVVEDDDDDVETVPKKSAPVPRTRLSNEL